MRRSEARIARAAQQKLSDAEKSARLRDRPSPEKTVRLGANPGSIYQTTMTWTVEHRDCEGAWQSGTRRQWTVEDWNDRITPKLIEWGKLTWAEIDTHSTGGMAPHKMHHSMPVEALLDEAQDRLLEIDKAEETIFRFRLGNLPRLWGFRRVAEFHVLWFDPRHEIYPTDPS